MAWTDTEIRERLTALYRRLPGGSKASLARVCGFKDRRDLRAMRRSGTWLIGARRLERVLRAIESGELVLIDTGKRCKNPAYPVLVWQWRERSSLAKRPPAD